MRISYNSLNRYLRTIRSFHPTFTTFNLIQPLGRHIRRPRSDLDLICPSSRHNPKWDWLPTTFTHLTALEDVFQSSFIHKLCPVFWATCTRHAGLIHRFLCFTTKEIIGISKVCISCHTYT